MPIISPEGPLPTDLNRVEVAGPSGSGKSWLASTLASAWDLPYVELDSLYHGPGWVPREQFVDDVTAFVARDQWVTEWQYSMIRPLIDARLDLMIWLDLPTHVVMRRVVRRTISRRIHRTVLWNGNVEPGLWTVLTQPDHVVRMSWKGRPKTAPRIAKLAQQYPDLTIVRLRSQAQVQAFVERFTA